MRQILIVFIATLVTTFSIAQSTHFNVKTTVPFKDVKSKGVLLDVHQVSNTNTVIVRSIKKDLLISEFNGSHKIVKNIELEIDKKESFVGSVVTGDVLRIFTSNKISKQKQGLYCRTYDLASKKISKKLLFEVDREKRTGFSLYGIGIVSGSGQEQDFRVSPNGEYIAFSNSVYSKKESASTIIIFDKTLQQVFSKKYYNRKKNLYQIDDFVVTNDAKVIVAGKSFISGTKEKKKGKVNYNYEIHVVKESENTKKEILLGDKYIQQLKFAQNDDKLRLLGFYSEKGSLNMKGGISYSFKNTNINDIELKTTAFPASV